MILTSVLLAATAIGITYLALRPERPQPPNQNPKENA